MLCEINQKNMSEYVLRENGATGGIMRTDGEGLFVIHYILLPSVGVLVAVTNLLVVVSSGLLLKRGQEPRCTYLLLGNVALADLIIGLIAVIEPFYPQSLRSHTTCRLYMGSLLSVAAASIYSVALIAVDRFLYILHGLKYHRLVYITRVRSMIAATWVFGLLIGFLPFVGWSKNSLNGDKCWFSMVATPKLFVLATTLGIIPILFVIILYSIILYNAIQKVIQLRSMDAGFGRGDAPDPAELRVFRGGGKPKSGEENADDADTSTGENRRPDNCNAPEATGCFGKSKSAAGIFGQPNTPTKWKAIKVVLFTTGGFFCTWMPYFVASVVLVLCDIEQTPCACHNFRNAVVSPLAFLCILNSLLNPVIYAWWNNGFRTSVKKMYWKRKKITMLRSNLKRSLAEKTNVNTARTCV